MSRQGSWCQTYTGKMAFPLDPRPEDFCIEDIAHALSMICRFGGHCLEFYSVAEHSVHVSRECKREDALWGLLHDAAEAYVGDMVRPLKVDSSMIAYRDVERRIQSAICKRFGLSELMPWSVKIADNVMLATEARDLMSAPPDEWILPEPARHAPVLPIGSAHQAKQLFLQRFEELGGNRMVAA